MASPIYYKRQIAMTERLPARLVPLEERILHFSSQAPKVIYHRPGHLVTYFQTDK